jgi:hypothetical protein
MLLLGMFWWGYSSTVIFFPLLVGSFLILCSLWLFFRSLMAPEKELTDESEDFAEGDARSSMIKRIIWLSLIFPISYVFGYVIGLVAFGLAYTVYQGLPWWQSLITSAVILGVVYFGFYLLLGVPLPINPLWMR